ncbi:hypothetical protein EDF52_10272 [Curtobacterium sp. PhB42]|uniref:hypothetical protein n=1 Tax=unclassified Curtobacterium TaxID=257496 RepID=UPI001063627F|nr:MULTISPECIES: hypothetical protein [unclassified Curtobacterium]TDW50984.1 hypothetical protein EDF52_10272 [Curtobacterium sp. PhB42]TDW56170.1 hypothetical protein EDF47_104281 [Curtobacterium sp. PhB190]
MRRQTFTKGQTVGAGFTVVDPTRLPMKTNTYGGIIWGIRVRCPLCGDEFDSTISKLRTRLACTLQCAARNGLMGAQGGRQDALRATAEEDAERRLDPARRKMRPDHAAYLQEALRAFAQDFRYAEAMAHDAVMIAEAKAAGRGNFVWRR